MKYIIPIITIALCSGCELIEREIDPEIEPHVNEFYYQASRRGLDLPRPNLKIVFKNMDDAQGRCKYLFKTIYIDKNSKGWKCNPEALVFHELAHLILKRDHLNEVANKYCVSIMSNQDDPIYDYSIGDKLYERRIYYLDELFNQNPSTPEWMN